MLSKAPERSIILVADPMKKMTRHYLIEDVSQEAAAQGYKPGDILVAQNCYDAILSGGAEILALIEFKNVIFVDRNATIDQFSDLQGKPMQKPASLEAAE